MEKSDVILFSSWLSLGAPLAGEILQEENEGVHQLVNSYRVSGMVDLHLEPVEEVAKSFIRWFRTIRNAVEYGMVKELRVDEQARLTSNILRIAEKDVKRKNKKLVKPKKNVQLSMF